MSLKRHNQGPCLGAQGKLEPFRPKVIIKTVWVWEGKDSKVTQVVVTEWGYLVTSDGLLFFADWDPNTNLNAYIFHLKKIIVVMSVWV